MANADQNQSPKRLTLDDPVGEEALKKLAELENVEINTALQLMGIKQEEVRLLAVGRKIDDERHKLFEKLLMERGLAPNAPATIDSTTGKLTLVKPPVVTVPQGPTPPAAQPVSQPNGS